MSPPIDGRLEAAECLVEVAGEQFPYEVDLASGNARIRLGESWRTLAPLSWREKVTLARYAGGRAVLVDQALLQHRLGGAEDDPTEAGSPARRALILLARWLNGYAVEGAAESAAAPLDPVQLAVIETQALRSSGLSPAELDRLPALEVEQIAVGAAPAERPPTEASADQAGNAAMDVPDGLTRILVVPDPDRAAPEESHQAGTRTSSLVEVPQARVGTPRHPGNLALIRADAAAFGDLPYLAAARPRSATKPEPTPAAEAAAEAAGPAPEWKPAGVPASRPARVSTFAEPAQPAEPVVPRPVPPSAGPGRPAQWSPQPSVMPAAAPVRHTAVRTELAAPTPQPAAGWSPLTAPIQGRAAVPAPRLPARPAGPNPRVERTRWLLPSTPPAPQAPRLADDQLDYVLGEFARRLEQAVSDLGLDPED